MAGEFEDGGGKINQIYIMATPVKNEEENLPELITSVGSQKIKPTLWVIVDDGSTDKSSDIINKASQQYNWIKTVRLKESPRDIGFHYSHVCMVGFENSIRIAKEKDLQYGYIALLDADMRVEPEYFKKLIDRMEKNEKIGISSGDIWSKVDGKYIHEKRDSEHPSGGARIWRRKCFEETGGYELVKGPDSVSTARAKLRGWKAASYEDIKAYQSRPVSSADGLWVGYMKNGEARYFRHVHPLAIMGKSVQMIFKGKLVPGIAYLWGYLHAHKMNMPRLKDPELIKYFRAKSFQTFLGGSD